MAKAKEYFNQQGLNMYSYIIVGAGSAGCVLARRLSEDPKNRVCLIEAGPEDKNPLIHIPLGLALLSRSKTLNWNFETQKQPALKSRSLYWPRGKTLGGSSSINAMVYIRGHKDDYDNWHKQGNEGWSFDEVLPFFKKSEDYQSQGDDEFHGQDGPLTVSDQRCVNPVSDAFVSACEEVGLKRNPDFNGENLEGAGRYHVTQRNGERCSTAKGFLVSALSRPNLDVISAAHVTRVLFSGSQAVGVEYIKKGVKQKVAISENGEVLLSGGTLNTPQLLMLSGVGPEAELARHNIGKVKSLPGVGQNLQDHLDITILHKSKTSDPIGVAPLGMLKGVKASYDYLKNRKGFFTSNGAEAGGFIKSDDKQSKPNIQFHFLPVLLKDHGRQTMFGYGYTLHACDLQPKSRGHIALHSSDPLADPLIQPNYLDDEEDLNTLVKAFKLGRKIFSASSMGPYRESELTPGYEVMSDTQIREDIRQRAESLYHPVGTCKMGQDEMAVVGADLKVHGLQSLRVVDASIMPNITSGNTNAPTIMIAEKAAHMILNGQ